MSFPIVNSYLLSVKFTKVKREKILASIKFYIYEKKKHEENEAEIFCCLHNNLEPIVCEMLIDSNFPGFMEKNFSSLTTHLDKLNRNEKFRKFMHHSTKLGGLLGHYSDVAKDTFLFFTILNINGGIKQIFEFPTKFTSLIIIFFGSSIIFPLLISSIHLAKNNYQMIYSGSKLSKMTKTKICFLKIGVILLSIFNPIILKEQYENVKEKTRLEAKKLNSSSLSQIELKINLWNF